MSALAPGGARDEFLDFCATVQTLCGVDLAQYKRGQLERRIRSYLERRGAPGLNEYASTLRSSSEELDAFLDRVTINVSQLWRNPAQWNVLADHVLPELSEGGAKVRSWSAGCSYGAEAYTLAAVATSLGVDIHVKGTDIDKRMVARARSGIFSAEDARDGSPELLRRFFTPTGDGGHQAGADLQRLVSFEIGDLLRMRTRAACFDLVLCRNTVIYFNEDVRDALHARLAESLRPGGYLVVGATERVARSRDLGLTLTHPFTYRKAA